MKLYYAPASPFARKVVACAIARGVAEQIERIECSGESAELVAVNPLGKLPCLVTEDGTSLYDSRVICEFLDTVGDVYPMFPEHGLRMRALRFQALADGMCDALVLRRGEQGRVAEPDRARVIETQAKKVTRSLAVLEADPPTAHLDIGSIAVACALGYMDLRFPNEPWRNAHPRLAAFCAAIMEMPCMVQTKVG